MFDMCQSTSCYEFIGQTQKLDLTATHCLPRDRKHSTDSVVLIPVPRSAQRCCSDALLRCFVAKATSTVERGWSQLGTLLTPTRKSLNQAQGLPILWCMLQCACIYSIRNSTWEELEVSRKQCPQIKDSVSALADIPLTSRNFGQSGQLSGTFRFLTRKFRKAN